MRRRGRKKARWSLHRPSVALLGMAVILFCLLAVRADNNWDTEIIEDIRKPMEREGYLKFHSQNRNSVKLLGPDATGEERTGWTDVRHPGADPESDTSPDLPEPIRESVREGSDHDLRNIILGYDRSDFFVYVHTNMATTALVLPTSDKQEEPMTKRDEPVPQMQRDFNFANQIFAQAGISVLHLDIKEADFSGADGGKRIESPVDLEDQKEIQKVDKDRNPPPVVNNWYARAGLPEEKLGEEPGKLRGRTLGGTLAGTMIFTNAQDHATFAHELGHLLLDGGGDPANAFRFVNADRTHSPLRDDLMASGSEMLVPNSSPKPATGSPATNARADIRGPTAGAPQSAGRFNLPIGTTCHFNAKVKRNNKEMSQIAAMHEAPFLQRTPHADNDCHAGDVADFDWVEDNIDLEDAGGKADLHPNKRIKIPSVPGFGEFKSYAVPDGMVWEIDPNTWGSPRHTGHNHGKWPKQLPGKAYGEETFGSVDVISQTARYADMDTDDRNWNRRAAALDYDISFSADGENWEKPAHPLKLSPRPRKIFTEGWTKESKADDYVARWISPIQAKYVRIQPRQTNWTDGSADGNTQIDAVIAAPEGGDQLRKPAPESEPEIPIPKRPGGGDGPPVKVDPPRPPINPPVPPPIKPPLPPPVNPPFPPSIRNTGAPEPGTLVLLALVGLPFVLGWMGKAVRRQYKQVK